MRKIGITGGIGAGKSAVLAFLKKEWGAYVLQADQVGHQVMEPGGECYEPVIRLFGKEIIKNDKTIDRSMVSDVVFSKPDLLEKLNQLIHPAVKRFILCSIQEQEKKGCPLFVVEAALLLEERYQDFLDEIWYVRADQEVRIRRLADGRGYSREKAEKIIQNQASDRFFLDHSDFVVENNGDLENTYQGIRKRLLEIEGMKEA